MSLDIGSAFFHVVVDTQEPDFDKAESLSKCITDFIASIQEANHAEFIENVDPEQPHELQAVVSMDAKNMLTCDMFISLSYYVESTKPGIVKPKLKTAMDPFLKEVFPKYKLTKKNVKLSVVAPATGSGA